MPRCDGFQCGLGGAALVDGKRAARREWAPGRQRHQRGRRSRDRNQPFAAGCGQTRHRAQKSCGVGHPAVCVQIRHRCRLHRAAGVHHQRPVGELGHHAQIMGDDQHPCAGHVAGCLEHLEYLRLHRDVESGGRLVADDQIGVIGARDRDHHSLTLTTGEFVGKGPRPRLGRGDADEIHEFDRPPPRISLAHLGVVHRDGLGDLIAHGVHRRQCRHRVLEHGADARPADPRQVRIGGAQ